MDIVLRSHEASLRQIYSCLERRRGLGKKLMPLSFWIAFVRKAGLTNNLDLTERDATLCFVWSRMAIANPY